MLAEKLRILRVIARTNVGGPALHVSFLTARLDPDRFESLLATGDPESREGEMFDLRPELRAEVGDRLVHVPGLRRQPHPIDDPRALYHLWKLIGSFRPHIVHTHTAKAGMLGRLAAFARRVPITLHTFHGTVFEGTFQPPVGTAIAAVESVMARFTTRILTISPAVVEDLEQRRIGRGRITIVPLGLDLAPFLDVPAIEWKPRPVVTLAARLVPVKNVAMFIDAVRIVQQSVPDLEVLIAGDGPLRPRLEATAPSFVRFLGHHADMPGLLTQSAVVVLSSRSEGTPVAFMEALSAGRPVVAVPAIGGVVDILRDRPGAIVTATASAEALAEGIREALDDPSYAEGAASGRHKLVDEFGADRLVRDMQQLYEELWFARGR